MRTAAYATTVNEKIKTRYSSVKNESHNNIIIGFHYHVIVVTDGLSRTSRHGARLGCWVHYYLSSDDNINMYWYVSPFCHGRMVRCYRDDPESALSFSNHSNRYECVFVPHRLTRQIRLSNYARLKWRFFALFGSFTHGDNNNIILPITMHTSRLGIKHSTPGVQIKILTSTPTWNAKDIRLILRAKNYSKHKSHCNFKYWL